MAAEPPDPKTFGSWEEAFQYPIPAVRGMERELRRDIDSNREKLRTLVGASYRDLLGTAESIIEMDGQMHKVEAYMGETGQRCNTRLLEKKGTNLRSWTDVAEAPNSARLSFASQLAILRSCPDVISRLLKAGGSSLLAAKVLVLSRLLHTKLSQRSNPPPYLNSLRNRLASLRRRLLDQVDRRFRSLESSRDVLVEAMCAFSLATSSSPKDVLRHYHHIRLEAISGMMEGSINRDSNMLLALRLYVTTLRDTQAVMPGSLANALEKLKSVPIFKSQDLKSLIELNLDIHERWIAEDIKAFTPYIRHDDLSKAEAERSIKQWAKKAFSTFLEGLRKRIKDVGDPLALMQLRREIIELWLSNHQHSLGIDSAEALDGLRDVFNAQASRIVHRRASTLARVSSIVQQALQDWQPGISDVTSSLWDLSTTSIEMTKGAKKFREALSHRSVGKTGPLNIICEEYSMFLENMQGIEEVIKRLREAQWASEVDDVDDEDDLLDNKQALLSQDDPGLLQEELNTALHEAYTDLQMKLYKASPNQTDPNRGQKSTFLDRVWREIRQNLPKSYQYRNLGLNSIPMLHRNMADEVLRIPLERCSKRLAETSKASGLPTRPLWEGDPELPVLPSAWAYRLLLDTVSFMTMCGSDVWSACAVDELKQQLILHIIPLLRKDVKADAEQVNGHTNGDVGAHAQQQVDGVDDGDERSRDHEQVQPDGEDPEMPREKHVNGLLPNGNHGLTPREGAADVKIQKYFDISYIINATAVKNVDSKENGLVRLQETLMKEADLEPRSAQRMKKDAGEYWKRTNLLFALLI